MEKKSISEIRSLLDGPVCSIPTTFNRDGSMDLKGTGSIIEAGISGGSAVSLLTYGDSQLEVLSDDELTELTRALVNQSNQRSMTVAANKFWGTKKTMDYARFCSEIGIDLLMVFPGMILRQLSARELSVYYKEVAKIIPVMIVGCPEHALLDELTNEPQICCFKEDGTVEYAFETMKRYGDTWTFMSGGGLWRNYTHWMLGCHAFMSLWCTLLPEINSAYLKAMKGNDMKTACDIIINLDVPVFDIGTDMRGGWESVWRGIFEILGYAKRYMRSPLPTLSDSDMEKVKDKYFKITSLFKQ